MGLNTRFGSRRRVEVTPNGLHQLGSRPIRSLGHDIDPLRLAQEVLEGPRQRLRVSMKRDDPPALRRSPLDLFADVRGCDGMFGENKYHDLGDVDRLHDLVGIEETRHSIPRCDRTPEAMLLEYFQQRNWQPPRPVTRS